MSDLTVNEVVGAYGTRLHLEWVEGLTGGDRPIVAEMSEAVSDVDNEAVGDVRRQEISAARALVGHLNLIHPNQVQILGLSELEYLANLRSISRRDAFNQLIASEPSLVIVGEDQPVPEALLEVCAEHNIPLCTSPHSSDRLVDSLYRYLTAHFSTEITLHGVYLEVAAIGVLLTGRPGIGKSELALELITRGARLVADDAPQFSLVPPDIVNGTCPGVLQDFLEVRGIGLINVRELFGDSAIKRNKYLRLIIDLHPATEKDLRRIDRLEGAYANRSVLGLDVPQITLPVAPGRNLAVLVECAARNHMLRMSGYSATSHFNDRQRIYMDGEAGDG